MRGLFAFAAEREYLQADPTRGLKLLNGPNNRNGFHTWTDEEVARFKVRWSVGTRERLALDLLFYTDLRRGDAARVGRPHVRDGRIRTQTEKIGQEVTIRILPPLADSIAASPAGDLTDVAGGRGRPMTKESFGNWFRDACAKAGVPGRAHGLRTACRGERRDRRRAECMVRLGWGQP
ncbi:hypothetical protein MKK84_14710 [Methylobacterium sp. E-065]|uniref:hypothetical protein n=1 Tax=Methylobacterium sp. E-065 TaxID=2836583 RepID=UPI001FB986EA|nr:hypothetical protein [Methylobacterium sp. E-065]MCJ2018674.1 hypothetical protein [Methylobacterium sp. E-065]